MERTRATWTDERLDDLSRRMDQGFDRIDAEIRGVRSELGGRIDSLHSDVNARFDALQRTLLQVGGGIIAAIVALIATQI